MVPTAEGLRGQLRLTALAIVLEVFLATYNRDHRLALQVGPAEAKESQLPPRDRAPQSCGCDPSLCSEPTATTRVSTYSSSHAGKGKQVRLTLPTDPAWPNRPNTTTSISKASWSVSSSHKMPWSLGVTAPWLSADAPGQGQTPSSPQPPHPRTREQALELPLGGAQGSRRLSVLCPDPQLCTRSSGSTVTQPGGSGSQPSLKSTLSLPATHQPLKPRRRDSSRQPPDHTELLSVSPDKLLVCARAQTQDRKPPAW